VRDCNGDTCGSSSEGPPGTTTIKECFRLRSGASSQHSMEVSKSVHERVGIICQKPVVIGNVACGAIGHDTGKFAQVYCMYG
jgi:hypothetical protein